MREEVDEKGAITNQIAEDEADLKLIALVSECNDKLREEAVKRQIAIRTVDRIFRNRNTVYDFQEKIFRVKSDNG